MADWGAIDRSRSAKSGAGGSMAVSSAAPAARMASGTAITPPGLELAAVDPAGELSHGAAGQDGGDLGLAAAPRC